MDLEKYRNLFLEEGSEHLAEMSRALLTLEKDPASEEALEVIFRMAHSIKSMAASLGYDSISEVSHRLEDHMEKVRGQGCVSGPREMMILFRGLEALEQMLGQVRDTGECCAADSELIALLSETVAPEERRPKKALR